MPSSSGYVLLYYPLLKILIRDLLAVLLRLRALARVQIFACQHHWAPTPCVRRQEQNVVPQQFLKCVLLFRDLCRFVPSNNGLRLAPPRFLRDGTALAASVVSFLTSFLLTWPFFPMMALVVSGKKSIKEALCEDDFVVEEPQRRSGGVVKDANLLDLLLIAIRGVVGARRRRRRCRGGSANDGYFECVCQHVFLVIPYVDSTGVYT